MTLGPLGFIILAVTVVVFFVLPVLVFVIELVAAFAAVLFLRRPWIIEATTDGPPPETKTWKVRGPLRRQRALQRIASELMGSDPDQSRHTI
ncbi:MAG TPA: hypothetical protein VF877_07665 [Gaiellaceae bacterium]